MASLKMTTALAPAMLLLASCSASTPAETASAPPATNEPSTPPPSAEPTSSPPAPTTPPGPSVPLLGTCSDPIPPGAAMPPPLPTYAGTCPTLATAPAETTITSSGAQRRFVLVRPSTIAPGEKLPLVFAWHWLNGSPEDMVDALELQSAADLYHVVFAVPDAKGDLFYQWPMMSSRAQSRVDEEMTFFDDMLACIGAQLPIATHCVSSLGVSAGALFTAQLASARAERLASFVSLSGGVGSPVRPWQKAARPLPALLLWGGPTDRFPNENIYIFDFEKGSTSLGTSLSGDGHALVECIHNCGHDVPPFEEVNGEPRIRSMMRFILDHPYWTTPGLSPYTGKPLPSEFPAWCAPGHGAAVPRTGACP